VTVALLAAMLGRVTSVVRRSGIWAALGLAGTVAACAGAVALEAANGAATQNFSGDPVPTSIAVAVWLAGFPSVAALIAWRRPRNSFGWLLLASMAAIGFALLAHAWAVHSLRAAPGSLPAGAVAAWVATWLLVAGVGLLPFVIAVFPTGRVQNRWLGILTRVAAVALVAAVTAQAFAPDHLDGVGRGVEPIANPLGIDGFTAAGAVTGAASMVLAVLFLAAIACLVVRLFRAPASERRQLRNFVAALGATSALLLLALVAELTGQIDLASVLIITGQVVGVLGCAAALLLALLRDELYGMSAFARRLLIGAALSSLVLATYVVVVLLLTRLTSATGAAPPVIAAAVVAFALGPLRGRLQKGVDRLLFGWRAEPQRVLTELSDRLAAALMPDEVLPVVVSSVARTLRLPHARVELGPPGLATTVASYGVPVANVTVMPFVHEGRATGALVVGHRSGEERFRDDELVLLRSLAAQTSAAAQTVALREALRQAHDRTIRSREDERRRLRRELHDGVGPALAGLSLQLDAALAAPDPTEAADLLRGMRGSLQATVAEVRRVVHDLRPPALDELGLAGALREQANGLAAATSPRLEVALDLPDSLELPAAVEVALYRVGCEALTNVVRHAGAHRCTVRMRLDDDSAVLEVIDDGCGISAAPTEGIGLGSMRERAEELGGDCTVTATEPHGTWVRLRVPVTP